MALILAIDPGPKQSAMVVYDSRNARLVAFDKLDNYELLDWLTTATSTHDDGIDTWPDLLAVEMIASYGMPVGAEVFDTCVWIGRYVQAWGGLPVQYVYRREVKLHLCGSVRAKDGNVRRALLDRFGPGKQKAIGTKAEPGPLYGVTADVWAALGIAVTMADSIARKAISWPVANDNEAGAAIPRTTRDRAS